MTSHTPLPKLGASADPPNNSFAHHLFRVASEPPYHILKHLKTYTKWYLFILLLFTLSNVKKANAEWDAEILNCSTITDNYVGNAQIRFKFMDWVNRGLCIRRGTDGGGPLKTFQCYSRLQSVIANNLNDIRKAEYNGAAGVLALLPTIGGVLGTPTNEIWRLLTMIPLGGFLAMACSFGGAILPVKMKDYESKFMKRNIKGNLRSFKASNLSLPDELTDGDKKKFKERAAILMDKVIERLEDTEPHKVPKSYILIGITGMFILLSAAHVAMTVVELGAVLPWWCISKWWVHLWYMMVITSAAVDNYVQLPFEKQWRLCLSNVPNDYIITGGEYITDHVTDQTDQTAQIKRFQHALLDLKALKAGAIQYATPGQAGGAPRNVLFVLVSVKLGDHNWKKTFTRSLSKITSLAVFIVGTACFASAQLLSIAMATFVLTCVLGAGVFGRAITSWIVSGIETADPMVHYVAENDKEAHYVLTQLFMIGTVEGSGTDARPEQVQVELHGNVFLDRRRIKSRSPWPARMLGILNAPYDLRKSVHNGFDNSGNPVRNVPGNGTADAGSNGTMEHLLPQDGIGLNPIQVRTRTRTLSRQTTDSSVV